MNPFVIFFFAHSVIATLVLGILFIRRNDSVLKSFGVTMLLNAIAFTIWSFGLISPENLNASVSIGNVFFLSSLVSLFYVSVHKQKIPTRWLLTALSAIAVACIFYVGYKLAPGHRAYISPEGLLFFNGRPITQMLYIFAFMIAALPAIELLANKFKASYSSLVRYILIIEVVGGIMLITSVDFQTLNIVGWIMGLAYLLLWTSLLFSKKAWAEIA
ncbi:MAG: hypothetical protein PHI53_00595 [Candidatus Pacebacteria bacterium]|nr:hypothetical protein [Candidatus Paceibacterota bacterium]